jgi:methylase of polypeptide subunit release factors
MSIARQHAEWLSLVPVSGPFLSLPVLLEAFPQGLDAHDPDHARSLRQEEANWRNNLESRRANPAAHRHWILFVLNHTLELDERVLVEGQAIPQSLQVEIPERHELIRPSFAVLDPQSRKPRLLIQSYPAAQELSGQIPGSTWKASPETRMAELLHATGVRLGLITNGEHWMLVDAPKDGTTGFASWYAPLWLEEPITLQAFRSLLCASRFFNAKQSNTLEALLAESASNQQEVTDQLGYQVRKAVEVLIHSLDKADQDFGRALLADVPEGIIYESALTVMMRLVFLFCAEERDLIPSKPFLVYEENYSVSSISKQLRELADKHTEELLERRYDAWPRLLAAFRAIHGGLNHSELYIPAYGGNLFNPDRFPFLEGRKRGTSWKDSEANPLPVNNRTVLHLLEALQLLQIKVPGGGPAEARRLSFRALDIEQIGHVYEGLLDHTAKRAAEPFLGLAGTRDKEPELPLAKLEELLAKGEADLVKFLKEETGKSDSALKKSLNVELDKHDAARFRTACQSDNALWKRVEPLAGLVRQDNFGYPVVIPKGSVFVTAGTDRRSSGTHYTPRSLTEPIVQYTLEPLVYVGPAEGKPKGEWKLKSAKELLELKICDMACGSGAFLVQAARYMAERLLEAWDNAKKANPTTPGITPEGMPSTGKTNEALIPDDPAERKTYAMRIIAQRCLYGVDKNPLAAEMAKLSLWLLTLAKDKPFEFLDHSIRCGDSLVGLHSIDQLRHYSLKPDADDAVLFKGPLDSAVDEAINLRLKLEDMPANTVDDVQRQEKLLIEANEKIARLRCAADLLVAAEFWGESAKDKSERVRHAAVKSGHYVEKGPTEEFERSAAKERRGQTMFHWPLEFPEVIVKRGGFDAFVGNPPFLGGTRISTELGSPFLHFLQAVWGKGGRADLCTYFLVRACALLSTHRTCGFLTTNTISQGDSREMSLDSLTGSEWTIVRAIPSRSWPGVASLEIAQLWLYQGDWGGDCVLNDSSVAGITPYLTVPNTVTGNPHRLAANAGKASKGVDTYGTGFVLDASEKDVLLSAHPECEAVIVPYINGAELNSIPDQTPCKWVIHFQSWPLSRATAPLQYKGPVASDYPAALRILEERVKPERATKAKDVASAPWWQFWRVRSELANATRDISHVLARSRVASLHSLALLPKSVCCSDAVVVFAFEDFASFALLQSSFHIVWLEFYASSMRTDVRYTPTDCFETFPFPATLHACGTLGESYYQHRRKAMLQRQEGLTKTYNRFHDPDETSADIQKLRDLHVEMDRAVAAAYGWSDLELGHGFHETKQGIRFTISEPVRREVLQRLLKLNHERYAEEVKQGLHDEKKPGAKGKSSGRGKKAKDEDEPTEETQRGLFD